MSRAQPRERKLMASHEKKSRRRSPKPGRSNGKSAPIRHEIGAPTNFQHGMKVGTGGLEVSPTFDVNNLPAEFIEIFKSAGIKKKDLNNPETRAFAIKFVQDRIAGERNNGDRAASSNGGESRRPPPPSVKPIDPTMGGSPSLRVKMSPGRKLSAPMPSGGVALCHSCDAVNPSTYSKCNSCGHPPLQLERSVDSPALQRLHAKKSNTPKAARRADLVAPRVRAQSGAGDLPKHRPSIPPKIEAPPVPATRPVAPARRKPKGHAPRPPAKRQAPKKKPKKKAPSPPPRSATRAQPVPKPRLGTSSPPTGPPTSKSKRLPERPPKKTPVSNLTSQSKARTSSMYSERKNTITLSRGSAPTVGCDIRPADTPSAGTPVDSPVPPARRNPYEVEDDVDDETGDIILGAEEEESDYEEEGYEEGGYEEEEGEEEEEEGGYIYIDEEEALAWSQQVGEDGYIYVDEEEAAALAGIVPDADGYIYVDQGDAQNIMHVDTVAAEEAYDGDFASAFQNGFAAGVDEATYGEGEIWEEDGVQYVYVSVPEDASPEEWEAAEEQALQKHQSHDLAEKPDLAGLRSTEEPPIPTARPRTLSTTRKKLPTPPPKKGRSAGSVGTREQPKLASEIDVSALPPPPVILPPINSASLPPPPILPGGVIAKVKAAAIPKPPPSPQAPPPPAPIVIKRIVIKKSRSRRSSAATGGEPIDISEQIKRFRRSKLLRSVDIAALEEERKKHKMTTQEKDGLAGALAQALARIRPAMKTQVAEEDDEDSSSDGW